MTNGKAWIAVDLDGTLAHYDEWRGVDHIGPPIPAMVDRVKQWLAEGTTVKVFTARVSGNAVEANAARLVIQRWLVKQGIGGLEITCRKDYHMIALWDDRCVQVVPNTGRPVTREVMRRVLPHLSHNRLDAIARCYCATCDCENVVECGAGNCPCCDHGGGL